VEDKRRCTRISVLFDVIVTGEDNNEVTGRLRDVGLQGMFVRCESPFAMGESVWFNIVLRGEPDKTEVVGKGTVVRMENDGLGIHFTAIDPECVQYLRNIIAYNADDPAGALDEMQGGRGLRRAEYES